MTATAVFSVAVNPQTPGTLYAGTLGSGVFKSTNFGASWTAANTGLLSNLVDALAIDPSDPSILYAGTSAAAPGFGVFKSVNGGTSWAPTALTTGVFFSLAIDPTNPSTLYAGSSGPASSFGVYKSINGGASWTIAHTGLTGSTVNALAIDPSAPATVYAGLNGGVFKTTNGGENWTAVNAGLTDPSVFALAIDPSAPAVYAATNSGVFKSTNGGANWATVNTGLTNFHINALAIDPSAPSTIYAGTYGGGVVKSTGGGGNWTALNAGLTVPFVFSLAVDPLTPTRIHAGTGGGAFDFLDIEPCVAGPTTLCLSGGRFKVTTRWATSDGRIGVGQANTLTGDTGYFTFFNPGNVEMLVKVLNGCGVNSRFWTFAGGLTDVNVVMTVTDGQTGAVRIYTNPQGTPFQPIQDTDAFATCPAARHRGRAGARRLCPDGAASPCRFGVDGRPGGRPLRCQRDDALPEQLPLQGADAVVRADRRKRGGPGHSPDG